MADLFSDDPPPPPRGAGRVAVSNPTYQPHRKRKTNLEGLAKNLRLGENGKYRWHWDPAFHAGIRNVGLRQQRMEA